MDLVDAAGDMTAATYTLPTVHNASDVTHTQTTAFPRQFIKHQMDTRGETVLAAFATARTLEEVCVPVCPFGFSRLLLPAPESNTSSMCKRKMTFCGRLIPPLSLILAVLSLLHCPVCGQNWILATVCVKD